MMKIRNPFHNGVNGIDCEIEHPRFGWIPYTCVNASGEAEMQDIWDRLQDMAIAAYVAPAPTVDQVKAEASRRLTDIVADYLPAEQQTWGEQIAEAERYLQADTGDEPDTPMLAPIAAARGLSVAEMAALVLSKRDAYAAACGAVLAAQSALLAMDPIPADYAADSRWED